MERLDCRALRGNSVNIYACSFWAPEEGGSGASPCRWAEVARALAPAGAAGGQALPPARPCVLHLGCFIVLSSFNNPVKGIPQHFDPWADWGV